MLLSVVLFSFRTEPNRTVIPYLLFIWLSLNPKKYVLFRFQSKGLLPVEEEKVGGVESANVSLDKIEATINMNAKPIQTLTDAISVTQAEVNLIKSLPQSPQQSTGSQLCHVTVTDAGQQQFDMSYANQCQTSADPSVYQSQAPTDSPVYQSQTSEPPVYQNQTLSSGPASDQMTQPQPTVAAQQTTSALEPSHTIQTLTPLQPHSTMTPPQQPTAAEAVATASQPIVTSSLVNVPEGQLPPPPAPPSATSIGVFDTNPNGMMSEMVTQSQMSNVLPPPPPLQPVQSVPQQPMNPIPEMNTLTNLVPVVEPTDPSMQQNVRPPMSVVIKSEPQNYADSETSPNVPLGLKVNDDNNNPIQNSRRDKQPVITANMGQPMASQMRGFPLCVISTTPTTYVSKNKSTIVAPKYELTLPPKKAKYAYAGINNNSAKTVTTTHSVPSTGMLYDLPQNATQHSTSNSSLRVQSGLTPPLKLPHSRPSFFVNH